MNNKYFICYKTRNDGVVVLITHYNKRKSLLNDLTLKKLFLAVFDDENYGHERELYYTDALHGNIYNIILSKREIAAVFAITKRYSFNFNGARLKFLELIIDKDEVIETVEGDIEISEVSLIHFTEFMKAKLNTLGYNKFI